MTWREGVVVRILLLVAKMFADESEVKHAIQVIANHIQVEGPRERREAMRVAGLLENDEQ